jgi:linoleoyl-CoA desaturase
LTLSCFLAGFISACILVIGHVNIGLVYTQPKSEPLAWQSYVVSTTTSFSTSSPIIAWITGGLTHHVAHHLHPSASRKQLRAAHCATIAAVEENTHITSVEFLTLRAALRGHLAALKELGAGATDLSAHGPERSAVWKGQGAPEVVRGGTGI